MTIIIALLIHRLLGLALLGPRLHTVAELMDLIRRGVHSNSQRWWRIQTQSTGIWAQSRICRSL